MCKTHTVIQKAKHRYELGFAELRRYKHVNDNICHKSTVYSDSPGVSSPLTRS
ncbi:unnamed protein product [Tenebrio molitor]|nr:unnamed protein product [Tenebrio molitor]